MKIRRRDFLAFRTNIRSDGWREGVDFACGLLGQLLGGLNRWVESDALSVAGTRLDIERGMTNPVGAEALYKNCGSTGLS